MRSEVLRLAEMGPLPAEASASAERLKEMEGLLRVLVPPASDEEARALIQLFGPDSCFGLAWSVLHFIESAPSWPLRDCLSKRGNEWIDRLRDRAVRAGGL